jgi:diaminobutyrate-2-oxoglutarate transaminase
LFIIDDIQAGCGRTGSFFSFEKMGLSPDIITMAKSLSGMGLPMALTLLKPELDKWAPGEHNGTFRGNCHAFVTARAAIETFWADDAFEIETRRKGALLAKRLDAIAAAFSTQVRGVKGRGMMLGLDVADGDAASRIVDAAFARGLVLETSGAHGQIVKLLTPLNISDSDLDAGLNILTAAMKQAFSATSLVSAA